MFFRFIYLHHLKTYFTSMLLKKRQKQFAEMGKKWSCLLPCAAAGIPGRFILPTCVHTSPF